MSAIEQFSFEHHRIRTLVIGARPWAVAADICAALAIKDVSAAMTRIDGADKMILRRSDTPDSNRGIWDAFAPQVQAIGLVSEDGATDLVLESRKPEARRFRKFLTHEVWPSIRDTGSYSVAPIPRAIPQTYADALRAAADEAERADRAEKERDLALEQAAELAPSAFAWDRLHELGTDFEADDAAKILSRDARISIGRDRLYQYMNDIDWIFRSRKKRWKAYQDQVDLGRLKHRPGGEYFDEQRGVYRIGEPTVLVTPKGLAELHRRLTCQQLELVVS